jgi:regulatory protein
MDIAAVKTQALLALGQREYSRKDLRKKLVAAGADGSLVDEVLDEMVTLGYLDHQRYAEAFTNKRVRQGYGPRVIRQELQQAGIESDFIVAALDDSDRDWSDLAGKLYRKKYGARPAIDLKEKARRARFLFSKGFSSDQLKHFLQGVDAIADDLIED